MILEKDKEFLEHFGVKGMHWGVNKSKGASGTKKKVDKSYQRAVTAGRVTTGVLIAALGTLSLAAAKMR